MKKTLIALLIAGSLNVYADDKTPIVYKVTSGIENNKLTLTVTGDNFIILNEKKIATPLYLSIGKDLSTPGTTLSAPRMIGDGSVFKVDLPDGFAAGDYLLRISTDKNFSNEKTTAFDITIGASGPKGDTGPQGPRGETGAQGPQGVQGIAGIKGSDGAIGLQGIQGAPGLNGVDGAKGDTGANGKTILSGPDLPLGSAGSIGDFYINFNDHTFYGPKVDANAWPTTGISLVGPKGDKGDTGAKGDTGQQGIPGANGADGAIGPQGLKGDKGETGATGLQGIQGPIGLQGLPGVKGDTGATGADGKDGKTIYTDPSVLAQNLGKEGDFYLDITAHSLLGPRGATAWPNVTTAVSLIGPKGADGTNGAAGSQGPAGPRGDTGATGADGAPGPRGLQGPQGDPGQTVSVNNVTQVSGNITLTPSNLGLGNVDNTSDVNKPISTPTQGALSLKAPLDSPALTGTPTAPTAQNGTNNTQIATTAFVQSALGTTYHVGDTGPNGGKVFYVDSSNLHGLEARTANQGYVIWYSAQDVASSTIGWRLPTKTELNVLFQNRNFVGGFFGYDSYYWSSTEIDASNAWGQDFFNGTQVIRSKVNGGIVRAVRAF